MEDSKVFQSPKTHRTIQSQSLSKRHTDNDDVMVRTLKQVQMSLDSKEIELKPKQAVSIDLLSRSLEECWLQSDFVRDKQRLYIDALNTATQKLSQSELKMIL